MKRILIGLFAIAVLAGCQSTAVPVVQKFPEAPAALLQPCGELVQLDPKNTKLDVIVESVIDNYSLYHECKIKHNNWIEWYRLQMRNTNG